MTGSIFRGRRLRRTPAMRALATETRLSVEQLVAPLFVIEGRNLREPIASMPGHARLSADLAAFEARSLAALGVRFIAPELSRRGAVSATSGDAGADGDSHSGVSAGRSRPAPHHDVLVGSARQT